MNRCIERHADDLILPTTVDKRRLLAALAVVESGGGKNLQPNFEPAFWIGGKFWNPTLAEYCARWESRSDLEMRPWCGKAIACSWGPWQILYVTAAELGYQGPPWALTDPDVCLSWAVRLINRRIAPKILSYLSDIEVVSMVGDGYNSGSATDKFIPVDYCKKLLAAYSDKDVAGKLVFLGDQSDFHT